MRKRKVIIWILAVLAFVAISNIPYVSLIYLILVEGGVGLKSDPSIHYSSNNPNGFSVSGQGGDLDMIKGFLNTYRLTHPQDSMLYRNFKMSPWKFWKWYYYLTSPYYKLPYAPPPPDAGEAERGGAFENGSRLIYKPVDGSSKDSIPYMVPVKP